MLTLNSVNPIRLGSLHLYVDFAENDLDFSVVTILKREENGSCEILENKIISKGVLYQHQKEKFLEDYEKSLPSYL